MTAVASPNRLASIMGLITRRQVVQQAALAAVALYGRRVTAVAAEPEGVFAPADRAAIRNFATTITGRVVTPETREYGSARLVFNRAFDRRPALIVSCANTSDVRRSLDFAHKQTLPVAVRGGGHSRAGFGVCDGGVVIDLSGLNRVKIDSGGRVALAGAGCLVADIDKATQRFGLATTMGGCPTVGIAGLTLGGGEGLLMSKYGAACDNLISARVITMDGRHIEASESSNTDLFWAIRGGGGNFGVLTELKYRLYPVTNVLAGTITYPAGRIPELLHAFTTFVAAAPDEMNVVGEVLPSDQGARFHMLLCHCGDLRDGESLLKPLRALGPQEEQIRVASYLDVQSTINPYAPVAHFQTNLFLPRLTDDGIALIAAAASDAPSNTRVFIVPFYGAITRIPLSQTAFPLRQPGYELDIMGRWTAPAEKADAVQWVKTLRDKLLPFADGVYSNQLGETSEELARASYGSNYARLMAVKRKYDPENRLRLNQNVKPN